MNRLLKIAGYIWIGSVFFWLITAAVIGEGSARGTVVFIFIMSVLSVIIVFGGYSVIQIVSDIIILFDNKKREELREELKHE